MKKLSSKSAPEETFFTGDRVVYLERDDLIITAGDIFVVQATNNSGNKILIYHEKWGHLWRDESDFQSVAEYYKLNNKADEEAFVGALNI